MNPKPRVGLSLLKRRTTRHETTILFKAGVKGLDRVFYMGVRVEG